MAIDFNSLPFDPRKALDPKFRLPDLSDCVEGWRAWRLMQGPDDTANPGHRGTPKLYSANQSYYWTPRRASIADCHRCPEDDLPRQACSCGFYSARSLEHLLSLHYAQDISSTPGNYMVIGQVANWGNVVECSQGYRAQKSYPVKLYLPFAAIQLARPLMATYGCPVKIKNMLRPDGQSGEV